MSGVRRTRSGNLDEPDETLTFDQAVTLVLDMLGLGMPQTR